MNRRRIVLSYLWTPLAAGLVLFASCLLEAQTSSQIARQVAENNEALRRYSWTLRVEIVEKGEKMVGLYKMRYDLDGERQATALSADAPAPEDLAPGIRALGQFAMSYAQPGAYQFQRFLNNASIWEGRGDQANTVRIEGENLHVAGDEVEITVVDGRPRKMTVMTTFEGEQVVSRADYRDLPNDGPAYVAKMTVGYPGLQIVVETFDYVTDAAAPVTTVTVPQGIEIQVRNTQPLSTKQNQTGETFNAIVDRDVVIGGKIVFPRGSRAVGRLVEVKRSGKVSGKAKMSINLVSVYLDKGPVAIQTELLSVEAESTKKRDRRRIGGLTGAGALVGAIAGGGSGAAKGAAIGAASGATATLLTRGNEVEFPAEQLFTFRLAVPVEVARR